MPFPFEPRIRESLRYLPAMSVWLGFTCLLVVCATVGQPSPDLWWQLAGGRLMVEQRVFPWHDPFSFTASGRLWLNHEWLAECVMYYIHQQAGGVATLHVVRMGMLGGAFWTVSRVGVLLGASEASAAAAAALGVLNAQWRYFFDVRPYLFTYAGLALTLLLAFRGLDRRQARTLWLLPPLFALWANIHSGVVAGLALMGLVTVGGWMQERSRAWPLLLATLASTLASLVNPYGVHILTFPFEFFGDTIWSAGLNEWARTDLVGQQWTFGLYLIFVAVGTLACRKAIGPPILLVTLGFGALSCLAWRHVPLFALMSVPAVAISLQTWGQPLARRLAFGETARIAVALGGAGAAALLLMARLHATSMSGLSLETRFFPVDAVRFLRAHPLPAQIYNAYGWGGYIAWCLHPRYQVFMDGRANTLYAPEVYREFLRIAAGGAEAEQLLEQRGVQVALLNMLEPARALGQALTASGRWRRLYADDLAEIYLRVSPATAALWRDADAGALWMPPAAALANARAALQEGRFERAEEILKPLVASVETEARARLLLAVSAVRRGRPEEAEASLRRAIALDPELPDAHYNLGALLMARGERAEAVAELEKEVRINPDSRVARETLARLQARP